MKGFRGVGHIGLLTLIGTLAIFINASSEERPLGRHSNALLPLLRDNHPYLLKGLDLNPEGIGLDPRLLPISLQGQDLSGMDLREARFTPSRLEGIELQGAHLARADFSCVALKEVDFAGADLSEARFDFSECKESKPTEKCPEIGASQVSQCSIIQVNLTGANLSRSLLQGKSLLQEQVNSGRVEPTESTQFCDRWLVIQGNLEGANFSDATLRCVVLINEMSGPSSKLTGAVQHADNGPTPPEYAGIKFVKSTLENVILLSGNFMFSDFWEARMVRMWVNLTSVDLRFTSLGKLNCPPSGCELWNSPQNNKFLRGNFVFSDFWKVGIVRMWVSMPSVALHSTFQAKILCPPNGCELWLPPLQNSLSRLSLNVRGSHIRTDIRPRTSDEERPALLCDGETNREAKEKTKWTLKSTSEPEKNVNVSCEQETMTLMITPEKPERNHNAPATVQAAINNEDGRR